jgi:hypothetical protein
VIAPRIAAAVLGAALLAGPGSAQTPPSEGAPQPRYAIQLRAIPASEDPGQLPALAPPPGTQFYWTSVERGGQSWHRLRLGDFPTLAAARAALALVADEFPGAWIAPIRGQSDRLEPAAPATPGRTAEAAEAPLPSANGPAETAGPRARPRLTARERAILERPDQQRFDEGPSLPVFGRPLIFGGQYTLRTRYVDEQIADGGATVDYLRLNNELKIDAFYPWNERVSVYLQGRLVNRNLLWATNEDSDDEWDAELGEGWLFLGDLLGSPVSLQIGRQRIFDEREWWWDEEFDAVRLHFDHEGLHAEASVADTLAPISTDLDRQDPEKQDIFRAFGRAMFEWAPKQQIGIYGLHQRDHSDPHFVGQFVDGEFVGPFVDGETEEDESDGDLTWLGISALGRRSLGRYGRLAYWLDGAYVWGDETFYAFTGPTGSRRLSNPSRIHDYSVRGWGIDVGATWELPLPGWPSLTLGYARGSGRSGMTEEEDRGFRQTGLQDDNWKWRGSVNRYKYYGELLEPELSNLQIFTAALGIQLLRNSSLTLAYHHFRQVEKADYLRDVSISADPDGLHRSIGQELDLILGIEEWKRVQLELIGGVFRAGAAFGPEPGDSDRRRVDSQAGDLSFLGVFQFRVNY